MGRCDDETMRTTLTIDDDILEFARALAKEHRTNLGAALSELARRGIPRASYTVREDGMPVFQVDPDAPPITSEDVYRALDDWP